MEFVRAAAAAVCERVEPAWQDVGLHQPRHRLLGAAQTLWRPVGNHAAAPRADVSTAIIVMRGALGCGIVLFPIFHTRICRMKCRPSSVVSLLAGSLVSFSALAATPSDETAALAQIR